MATTFRLIRKARPSGACGLPALLARENLAHGLHDARRIKPRLGILPCWGIMILIEVRQGQRAHGKAAIEQAFLGQACSTIAPKPPREPSSMVRRTS